MTSAIMRFSLAAVLVAISSPLRAQQASPGKLTATATGPTTVNLTWTAAEDATRYWVQRAVGAGDLANLSTPKITGTGYTDASAPAGTTLRYRVMAGFTRGSNTYSAVVSITTPATPTATVATPLTAPLSRVAVAPAPLASAITSSPGQPSLGIETAAPASAGTLASSPTGTSTINTAEMARQARLPQGAAAQGLVATAASPTTVSLSWTATAGATGYLVYRGATPDASGPAIATVPPPRDRSSMTLPGRTPPTASAPAPMTYLDAGVMPKSTVYYRIAATYDAQQTGFTPAVNVTTPTAQQPTGFFAISGPGSVTLSWHPAPGATSYSITRDAPTNLAPSPLSGNEHIHDTTYTDDNPWPGTTYVYRVIAHYTVQGVGEITGDLTQVPVAVATPRAAAPKDFRMTVAGYYDVEGYYGGTIIDLHWTPVPGATGYKVLRALASDGNFAEVPGMQYSGKEGRAENYEFARDENTVQIGQTYLYKLLAYYQDIFQKDRIPPGESQVLRAEVKTKLPGIGNLTGSSPQPKTVLLSWTPPPGAQGYVILRAKASLGRPGITNITRAAPPLDLTGTASSYTDNNNLWSGFPYYYDVVTWYGGDKWGEAASVEVKVR